MKKTLIITLIALLLPMFASAQKYALVDMEYILRNIPNYEMANELLEQSSKQWQAEVDAKFQEVQTAYKNYQSQMVLMTDEMKVKKEEEIIAMESVAKELQKKYFGPDGELFKKRESLIKPIQDDIYDAIKTISESQGYMMVIDRASSQNVIFASPRIDISNEVLVKLGYSN